jgi:hypothetical protein
MNGVQAVVDYLWTEDCRNVPEESRDDVLRYVPEVQTIIMLQTRATRMSLITPGGILVVLTESRWRSRAVLMVDERSFF